MVYRLCVADKRFVFVVLFGFLYLKIVRTFGETLNLLFIVRIDGFLDASSITPDHHHMPTTLKWLRISSKRNLVK